jgi:type I restriction enzyme S subunit
MGDDLPQGWNSVSFFDFCVLQRGYDLPLAQAKAGPYPVITSAGVAMHHAEFKARGPGVVTGRSGSIGRVFYIESSYWPHNTALFVKDFKGNEPRFVYYFLRGFDTTRYSASTAVPTLNRNNLREIFVNVPPLAEQRRIVAKLENLFESLSVSQERMERIPLLLKRFRQSILAAACSGRLTVEKREPSTSSNDENDSELPRGWKTVCIGDVITDLKYGTAQKCSYEKRGTPVLRIPNVANGVIDRSDLKFAVLPTNERENLKLHPGDILVIRSNGSVSLVGRSAVVHEPERDFAYAGYLIRLRPDRTIIDPEFLNLVLSSYDIRLQIELEARSTSGVNNINSEELRSLRFKLPTLVEQQEIVRKAGALFGIADQLEARYSKASKFVDRLTQSILAKAFRGELVENEAAVA